MTGWLGNGSANCGWLVSRLMTSCLMDYFRVPTISAYSVLCIHPFLPSEFFTQIPLVRNSYEKEHNDFNGCWRRRFDRSCRLGGTPSSQLNHTNLVTRWPCKRTRPASSQPLALIRRRGLFLYQSNFVDVRVESRSTWRGRRLYKIHFAKAAVTSHKWGSNNYFQKS